MRDHATMRPRRGAAHARDRNCVRALTGSGTARAAGAGARFFAALHSLGRRRGLPSRAGALLGTIPHPDVPPPQALTALGCMEHRGACSADDDSGDGAGLMTQIPWKLLKKEMPSLNEQTTG